MRRPDPAAFTSYDQTVLAETESWSGRIGAFAHLIVVLVIGSIVLVAFDTEHHTDPIATSLLLADVAVSLCGVPLARHRRLGHWLSWVAGLLDVAVLTAVVLETVRFPHMRNGGGEPLLIWIGSTSTRGGTPPYLGPYLAAKAAMESLVVTYAGEIARWGIETVILSPGV